MDPVEFERLVARARDPKLIPGIYNYCDGRCPRCTFTQRCLTYLDAQELKASGDDEQSLADSVGSSLQRTLEMLAGAMDSLIVGDPADPRTDVGPVIDRPSYDKLMGRREAMKDRIVKTVAVPPEGRFVPPTLIRIDAIEDLKQEWFGPLLHVATWKGGQLVETVRRVNASGFGLTMGLHSRIARAAETVEESGTVGNLYVNRSMIGAIVGSQPFGGEGQSGTGPKAGGPHYLPRFCAERVTSTDTTSAGGNATLLSLEDVGF